MFSPSYCPKREGRAAGGLLSWIWVVSSYRRVTSISPRWLPSLKRTTSLSVPLSSCQPDFPSTQTVLQPIRKQVPDEEAGGDLREAGKKQVLLGHGGDGTDKPLKGKPERFTVFLPIEKGKERASREMEGTASCRHLPKLMPHNPLQRPCSSPLF